MPTDQLMRRMIPVSTDWPTANHDGGGGGAHTRDPPPPPRAAWF
jgi:hypothetical protein